MAITLAVGDRLETKFLLNARVKLPGFDVELVNPGPAPAPIFNDVVNKLSYDVAELTISNYIVAKDQGVRLTAVPVFPNLFFPLTGLTAHKGAGIREPKDLKGKRVGVPLGFASNPAVWLRGILEHHYGLPADSIIWVEGERDSLAGIPYPRSPRFRTEKREQLERLVDSGEIDAMVVAGGNAEFSANVTAVTGKPYDELEAFFKSSGGVFPINTMIVLKESTVAQQPGLVAAVIAAFNETHAIYESEEPDDGIHQGLRMGVLRQMGLFPRPHGLDVHGKTVEAAADYLFEQGLTRTRWTTDKLFASP